MVISYLPWLLSFRSAQICKFACGDDVISDRMDVSTEALGW